MKKIILGLLLLSAVGKHASSQPTNEIGCFSNFDYDNSGNSKVNAYLLSLLTHFNYPTVLLNNENEFDDEVMEMFSDKNVFLRAFKKKVQHYFPAAPILKSVSTSGISNISTVNNAGSLTTIRDLQAGGGTSTSTGAYITMIDANNGKGYDPEAVIISTKDYIIINFRGTDRIGTRWYGPMDLLMYSAGEWAVTDFNAFLMPPPYNMPGKVHKGFNESLQLIMPRLVDSLTKLNYQSKKVWVTGHSLGAAHAQLCGTYLKKGYNIPVFAVYAYAAPHVGDADFVKEMDRLFPGTTLQRFDFKNDPATLVPLYIMGYARAGTRNYYSQEQGANYFFNAAEEHWSRIVSDLPAFCYHHTHWYTRAAYFELIDANPSMASKVPNCPARPTFACTSNDFSNVNSNNSGALAGIFNLGGEDVSEGVYVIVNESTGKLLYAENASTSQNESQPMIFEGTVNSSNQYINNEKWKLEKVGGLVGGYTIKSVLSGKVLDADAGCFDGTQCKITIRDRLSSLIPRTMQEWYVERVGDNNYFRIKNVLKSSMFLDAGSSKVNVHKKVDSDETQFWRFIKISN